MQSPFVVYTDLDGTLLDHDTYDWSPAAPMLSRLEALHIPVVLITSKTRAEVIALRQALGNTHPFVVENGAATVVPAGYFGEDGVNLQPADAPLDARVPGVARDELNEAVCAIRESLGLNFSTFAELGIDGIREHTGLDEVGARGAQEREASEPLLWRDDADSLAAFERHLAHQGLRCVRGGRFVHVLGAVDKALAMNALHRHYRAYWPQARRVVLGDGPNDIGMLSQADVAVVLAGKHGQDMAVEARGQVMRPRATGPQGWHDAMVQILEDHGYPATTDATGD